jgi:diguanylate cyclase (GGDEF)-like protein
MRQSMPSLYAFLEKQSQAAILAMGSLFIAVLGVIDYVTGPDLSLFIFYLVPVSLATWFSGSGAGIALSVLSAVAWSLADILDVHPGRNAAIPYWNLFTELSFFFVASSVLAGLRSSMEREQKLGRLDYLTGAVNSRYFAELADREIQRALRYNHIFTAAYLDLDNFKAVNDNKGHQEGDRLLKLVVATIADSVRATDIVARLGGDEFLILFPETDSAMAQAAIEKIRERLLELMIANGWPVTCSFGLVTFDSAPQSVNHLVKLADAVMYEVKNSGKDGLKCSTYSAPPVDDLTEKS